jgi:hypothetical protein
VGGAAFLGRMAQRDETQSVTMMLDSALERKLDGNGSKLDFGS